MESIFAAMLGGGEIAIILSIIMALAAIGVASLLVIAVSVWRRNPSGPKPPAAGASGAGHSPSR